MSTATRCIRCGKTHATTLDDAGLCEVCVDQVTRPAFRDWAAMISEKKTEKIEAQSLTVRPRLYGWIGLPVTDRDIARAKTMRAARDTQYRNLYEQVATDERWCGDLGEIMVDRYLHKVLGLGSYRWITKNAAGNADFVIHGVSVGLKTVKRSVPMEPTFTAQVSARHVRKEPSDAFAFACFEQGTEILILGAIGHVEFERQATYFGEGASVHESYTIRKGHEIYSIPVRILTPFEQWLKEHQPF